MIRTWVLTGAAALMTGTAACALDLEAMSASEKEAFGAAVREYLIENPHVLMEAIAVLEERQAAEQASADGSLVAAHANQIFDDGYSFVGGNPEGDVTLVEFIDYRCGYCRRAHPEVAELITSDGNIRKIIKEFPILGDESVEASRFAIAVLQLEGPEAYAEIGDKLIAHRGAVNRKALGRIATNAGLDADGVLSKMDSEEVTDVIRKNHALAQALQITGTPTFVIGDRMLRGYLPLDGMRDVVAGVRAE